MKNETNTKEQIKEGITEIIIGQFPVIPAVYIHNLNIQRTLNIEPEHFETD